ncbi:NAD/NADP octopine/nopaline dehydrogenase family protein [Streptomyces olindensis]|uniref:NAD/NADP octopine/nopaline dehydrogenase family protein n=1 Tax=Streptomyces olindensis TaxID=358823 RepID=UPI0033F274A2
MTQTASSRPVADDSDKRLFRVLSAIERAGNKLPHPFWLFCFWDFLASAYGVTEGTLVERIVQGYGRQSFPEPDSVNHRYFTEDIPFGLVIWSSLAAQIGLSMPLTDSFIALSNTLCGRDFVAEGRTAESLGLLGSHVGSIRAAFIDGSVC